MVRPWARLRAFLGGYFWMPCPVCDRMFGGHEDGGILLGKGHTDKMTCTRCPARYVLQDGEPWMVSAAWGEHDELWVPMFEYQPRVRG
jgi:hypothetical protein